MPIDPSIPLQVRPPAQRRSMLELLAQQRQNEMQGLQLQQARQQVSDQQAIRDAMRQTGGDVEAALPQIMQTSPQMGMSLQKSLQELKKTRLEHDLKAAEFIGQNLAGVRDQASYDAARQSIAAAGLPVDKMPPQFDPNAVQGYIQKGMSIKDNLEAQHRQITDELARNADKRAAELHPGALAAQGRQATVQQQQIEAGARTMPNEQGLTPLQQRDLAIREKTADNNASEAELQFRAAKGDQVARAALDRMHSDRIKIAQQSRPVTNVYSGMPTDNRATGEEYLAQLMKVSPGLAYKVKAIAEGRDSIPTGRAAVSGAGKQIVDAVYQYDRDFSTQRAQIRKAFTSGADGRNIGALNTASVHLDQLATAADALANKDYKVVNQVSNWFKEQTGKPAPTNFASLKNAVAGEMAAALKGQATDIEIHNISQAINAAQSPAALSDQVTTNLHILEAKLNTYRERYRQQIPNDTVWSPVLPSAGAVFTKHGVGTGSQGNLPGPTTSGGRKSLSEIFGR